MVYSIGILGIGFDKRKISTIPHSWLVFSNWTQFKERMTLLIQKVRLDLPCLL
ncbi:ABC transporter, periplasmic spermidine putrescine-binding protein PotD [Candidatus Similichlamydia laticola]|uniref:ABC transporter, periplasmic spermidine putrescine-binding protein PotD n=1 Tax=Candidatus Similichlamydia laticola TaxID=2170265 RepID=A0A369KF87_9BACT|nr:ABC transporter, periplasmic spermidine putrescine-binding protein PotD [Candidatus Similichlamydia laticola]